MKIHSISQVKLTRLHLVSLFSLTSLILSLTIVWQIGLANTDQLSLADILIALRSKKVTLAERNKILADAVLERGITFTLTAEIEKELETTGADKFLIAAIRQKSVMVKISATPVSTPNPVITPLPTPKPPDFSFYENRANASFVKGDYDLAVNDYSKSIELNPKNISAYLSRGMANFNKKNYELTIADYDKAIELNPKESTAYFNRGNAYEKMENWQKAIDDYQKAINLDANNLSAKTSLERVQNALAKTLPEPKKPEPAPVTETAKVPQIVELGQLNSVALNLVIPTYPIIAQKLNVQGKVIVQVTLDEEGKVVSAKATEGAPTLRLASEEAARKSKFKPTLVNNQAVKANGFIVYNFKGK